MFNKPIILVCDDHALIRRGLCESLKDMGTIHDCGENDFLDVLKKVTPDLIILDYVFEQTDGFSLLKSACNWGFRGKALLCFFTV